MTRYYRVSAINAAGTSVASGVVSATAEDTAPAFDFGQVVAPISGNPRVNVFFDEALKSTSIPDKSAFTVEVEGNDRTPTAADGHLTGLYLILTVNPVIRPGETVTVSYTKPGTNPLQDAAGNEVDSFTAQPVPNLLAATAPEAPGSLTATAVAGDGTKMDLRWTTPWANGDAITEFQVRYEAGPSVSATTMWDDITSGPTTTGHQVTGLTGDTEYTFEVRAVNGIGGGSEAAVTERTTDTTAPTFVSAGTNDTDEVVLTYDEALDTGSQPATSAFTVEVGGVGRGVDTVAISGSAVTLTLASAFRPGDALTVSYAKPGSNPIKDAANNEAVSLAETTVTNNLAATAPDAPGSLTANFDEISTAPLRFAADILALSWGTPWHNGSPIEEYQYRYAAGSSVPPSTAWTNVSDSAPGGATELSVDVTGLDAGTEYTFEVRAVNGINPGPAATVTRTTPAPNWSFTLRDSSNNNVTELTEGGDSATATVSITNNVRFSD